MQRTRKRKVKSLTAATLKDYVKEQEIDISHKIEHRVDVYILTAFTLATQAI